MPENSACPRISAAVAFPQLAEDVELRRRRAVEQLLELRHVVDLAAALEDVDALLGRDDGVAVEVGGALLELGEVLTVFSARWDPNSCTFTLPQLRRLDAVAELLPRERRQQEAQALDLLRIQDAVEQSWSLSWHPAGSA